MQSSSWPHRAGSWTLSGPGADITGGAAASDTGRGGLHAGHGIRAADLQVVATDVAARGLDIYGVEHIINMYLPEEFDSYRLLHCCLLMFHFSIVRPFAVSFVASWPFYMPVASHRYSWLCCPYCIIILCNLFYMPTSNE